MSTQGSYELDREREALSGDKGEERTSLLGFGDGKATVSFTLYRDGSFDLTGAGFSGETAPQAIEPECFSEITLQGWREQIQRELTREAEMAAWAKADAREVA
jgi:hypothetical protein